MSEIRSSSVSLDLRERGKPVWAAAISHPMVRQIGAGTLPHETFRGYFEQNILYLEDYARAIGLIIGHAPDVEAIDVLSRFLQQIVGTEIPANVAFLRRLGGSPAAISALGTMLPVTYGYTRHLLYTAAQGSCADGLTAVLPCQWSYGELATPLLGQGGSAAGVAGTTGLLDRLADPADAAVMARLSWIFDTSTRYEVQFWDMAYGEPAGDGVPAGDGPPPGKEPGR
jgi:thiaminase/transcriptional activator TenA